MELSKSVFFRFCELIYDKTGIRLGAQKEALVATRMGKRVRALGLPGYEAYYRLLVHDDPDGKELIEMINAISTNVTHFFREPRHFELLTSLLSQWQEQGQRSFSIWCAATATGEEAYSAAMVARTVLTENAGCRILATDISTRALHVARSGRYDAAQFQKVPETYRQRYFKRDAADADRPFVVADEVKRIVTHARLNLATPPFPMHGPMDVVFCRNVMIYFDNSVRTGLLNEIMRLLKPGGCLMVGHSESLSGMLSHFRCLEPSVYIK